MVTLGDPLPVLSTSAALRRLGGSTKLLEKSARAGTHRRLRRGAYLAMAEWEGLAVADRHLLLMDAAQRAARSPIVFSHESAAALWGIPLVGRWPQVPQATASPFSRRRSSAAIGWHRSSVDLTPVRLRDLLVTDPLRTVIDLLSARPFVSGAVSLDHVLHRPEVFGLTRERVLAGIAARRPFRNAIRAAAVARFATGASESPGESLSMVRLHEHGYPMPVQQKPFIGTDGREYFPDFYFPEADAIGESDGYAKYENPAFLRGRTPVQAFRDEKKREDALRPLVAAFVRWDWDDAWRGAPLFAKLERAGIRPLSKR